MSGVDDMREKFVELGDIIWDFCHPIKESRWEEGIQECRIHFQENFKYAGRIRGGKEKCI